MLVDSHCHLDFPDFADELEDVIGRAGAAGVGMLVTISTRLSTFDRVRAIAERYDNVFCTVGVHPHEADEEGQDAPDRLVELAAHPKVVGIGETGLDYYYDNSARDAQRRSFRAHLAAARITGLPVVVHTRDADDDMAAMLTEAAGAEEGSERGGVRGVLHCFSSSRALADTAVGLGFYISLSGIVTFKNATDLRDTVAAVPEDRILVETDAPYLAPVPMRGKRNEPAFVVHTAETVAALKGMGTTEFAARSTANFFALFDKAERAAAA